MQESVVFALRGFGRFRSKLGLGERGLDLSDTMKRQFGIAREKRYMRGIRDPLTNRAVAGMAEEKAAM